VYKYHFLTQIAARGAKRQKKEDISITAIRGTQNLHTLSLYFHIAVYKDLIFSAC